MKKIITVVILCILLLCYSTVLAQTDVFNRYIVDASEGTIDMYLRFDEGQENRCVTIILAKEELSRPISLADGNVENIIVASVPYNGMVNEKIGYDTSLKSGVLYVVYNDSVATIQIDLSRSATYGDHLVTFNPAGTYAAISADSAIGKLEQRIDELPDKFPIADINVPENELKFYVSPIGNDTNCGSVELPFASLKRALEAVKESGKSADIILRGGEYFISQTIDIDAEHNPNMEDGGIVTIRSYEGEKAVLSSGINISPKDFVPVERSTAASIIDVTARSKVLKFDLGAIDYDCSRPVDSDLYLNGRKLSKSRWPNESEVKMGEIINCNRDPAVWTTVYTSITPERLSMWDISKGPYFSGSLAVTGKWDFAHTIIKSFDADTGYVSVGCTYAGDSKSNDNITHYYSNVFEEIDYPGDWCIDKTNKILYIYPTEDFYSSELVLTGKKTSAPEYMISVSETKNIIFESLAFQYGKSTVKVIDSSDIIFDNCTFNGFGEKAVDFVKSNHCGVLNSQVSNIGNIGINFTNEDSYDEAIQSSRIYSLIPSENFVQNTEISECVYASIADYYGIGDVFSHNVISDMDNNGIIISACMECVAEYNEIFSFGNVVWDSGGVYCGGVPLLKGCVIRNNYIHDPVTGGVGVYFDDMSSNNYAYENIFRNCTNGVAINGGRENAAHNNIIINDDEKFEGLSLHAVGISAGHYYDHPAVIPYFLSTFANADSKMVKFMNSPLYESPLFKARYPEIFELLDKVILLREEMAKPDYVRGSLNDLTDIQNIVRGADDNYVGNNVVIGTGNHINPDFHVRMWGIDGIDTNITYEDGTSVGFVSYENSKFDLKNDAKLLKDMPEFKKIDFESIGLSDKKTISDAYVEIFGYNYTVIEDSNEFKVSWSPIVGADYYRLILARDSAFSDVVSEVISYDEQASLQVELNENRYYLKLIPVLDCNSYIADEISLINTTNVYVWDMTLIENTTENQTAFVMLKNTSSSTVYCNLYLAIKSYDGETRYANLGHFPVAVNENLSKSIDIGNAAEARMFVWTDNLKPCSEVIEIK